MKIKKKVRDYVIVGLILIIMIAIIKSPKIAVESAKEGLNTWFNILVPSLLPFFILSELLISLGFIESFGRLLQPIMGPLFNLPGIGAFPLTMSVVSGYPVGAKLTSQLRKDNLISRTHANRLICFSSTSGPLFILGSVLVGMLNAPDLSFLMIAPHYLGTFTIGLFFSLSKSRDKNKTYLEDKYPPMKKESKENKNNNSFGYLISRSIKNSIDSILIIGGFLIIYSLIINLLLLSKSYKYLILLISNWINVNPEILKGLVSGFIELTTGCKNLALVKINIFNKIILINFLIGWGGLSIHSQALSFISETDINANIYLFSKLIHGALSSTYTYILYLLKYKNYTVPSTIVAPLFLRDYSLSNWIYIFFYSFKVFFFTASSLFLLSILVSILFRNEIKTH